MRMGPHHLIDSLATWPAVALVFIAYVICSQGFNWRATVLGPQIHLLDTRIVYSPVDAQKLFELLGDQGRRLYAITELSLDLVFPLIYGSLFIVFLFRLYDGDPGRFLIRLPLLTMAADWLENGTAAYLALSFDGRPSALAWAGSVFTAVKWATFLACFFIVLIGGLQGILRSSKIPSMDIS
jgi:hypothetical protein